MKKILIIDPTVPQEDRAEGLAVYNALITGKCDTCKYLKCCSEDGDFKFPADAACMEILKRNGQDLVHKKET